MSTRVVICGAAGRMGKMLAEIISETQAVTLVGGVDRVADPGNHITTDLASLLENADAVIDFTAPPATARHAAIACQHKVAFVTGTTGLGEAEQAALADAAQSIAVVQAPNMSLGVNVLLEVVRNLASALPGYDIEIVETHHRGKVDAPSGTALRLAQAAAEGRDWDPETVNVYGRQGAVGARPERQIGVMTLRAGDVVGDHTVLFAGPGESLQITHRAHSRSTFAAGALHAAVWAAARSTPGLYDMRAVLGLA